MRAWLLRLLLGKTDTATVLGALEDASEYRSDDFAHCHDCPADQPCEDHGPDMAAARKYDAMYDRLARKRARK